MRRAVRTIGCCCAMLGCSGVLGAQAGTKLYGVHWWTFENGQIGAGAPGGWATETIITNSAPWWGAAHFLPLYQHLDANDLAEPITRIDYDWGETIPAPNNPDAANWEQTVLGVVNTLGAHGTHWQIGNEPNIIGEGRGWPNGRVTPEGYAAVYDRVRRVIKASRPNDAVLFAPPSPGPVIDGVRWMDGNVWLGRAIDAVLAIPGGEIDAFAIHAYGDPFATPMQAEAGFRQSYASQLALIDAKGFENAPVFLTEWARATPTEGDLASAEAQTAEFIRLATQGVHEWNETPGRHNIVGMTWFVQDHTKGGWEQFALGWWATRGHPAGHPGDLPTAFGDTSIYPAGLRGSRPEPEPEPDPCIADVGIPFGTLDFWDYARFQSMLEDGDPRANLVGSSSTLDRLDMTAFGLYFAQGCPAN